MEAVKQIATSIAITSAVIGSVYIICPSGTMSRQMKYVIGLITLLAVITPFLSVKPNFGKIESVNPTFGRSQDMLCSQAEYLVRSQLEGCGIECGEIDVAMDISDGTNISISSVTVHSSYNPEEIKEQITSIFPKAEVTVKNE